MRIQAVLCIVATLALGWGWGNPLSAQSYPICNCEGGCICVPNVRNFGYYRTEWRRWPTEVRRDVHFFESLGREQVPTPPGEPMEELPIEKVPLRVAPEGEIPSPEGILPPEGQTPFEPELPVLPEEEPTIPGGVPSLDPLMPETLPGSQFDGIPGLPSELDSPAPLDLPGGAQHNAPADIELPERQLAETRSAESVASSGQLPDAADGSQPPEDRAQRPGVDESAGKEAGVSSIEVVAAVHKSGDTNPADPAGVEAAADSATGAGRNESAPAATAERMPAHLDGFCPVTLSTQEQWEPGRSDYMAVYQGKVYYMAGPAKQQQFLEDPKRFVPMFAGNDPVLSVQEGRSVPGLIRYGVTFQGRVYLFSNKATLEEFSQNPGRYAFEILR